MDNTKKNIVWNTIGALSVSFTSLFYTLILTRIYPLDEVGVFTFAFSFACMMVTLASFGGRTFQVTDTENKFRDFSYILTRYITVLFTLSLVLIYLIIKNYSFSKFFIIFFLVVFKFFEEISDVYYGIIQKREKLYLVGIFQTTKSLINVLLFLIINLLYKNILISVLLLMLVNATFVFFLERNFALRLSKWKYEFKINDVKKILYHNFYICIFMFLSSYIISSPKYAIDTFLAEDNQAVFNIIVMPATFVYLIGSFILNPFLVNLAKDFNRKNYKLLKKNIVKMILILILLGLLVILAAYIAGIPVLNIVYGIELNAYKDSLLIVMVGAIFYSVSLIISTILIAFRKIKSQFYVSIILSIISYFLTNYLVKLYGLDGGFISYVILMFLRFICYVFILKRVFKDFDRESEFND